MNDKHAHIRKIDINDITHTFPPVKPWDEKIEKRIDIFITALGFEDRAVAVSKTIAHSLIGTTILRSALGLVCCYSTNKEDNERNRSLLSTALASFCNNQIDINADSPQEIENFLGEKIKLFSEIQSKVEIVFDISAASGNLILSVMHTILEYRDIVSLKILYAEPASYFPKQEEYDRDPETLVLRACDSGNLDSSHEFGVNDVQINELYPGVDGESRPEFVIAIPALRSNRLIRCLQHLSDQPLALPEQYIYWILSEPPERSLKWRLDFQKRLVKNMMSSMVGFSSNDPLAPQLKNENHSTCSTRDYVDILRTIIELSDKKLGFNLSLVHMGSKLQAVGISLALSVRNEIAVCGASPTQFNPNRYSEGVGTMWCIEIPDLTWIFNNLESVGHLTFTSKIETERSGLPAI